MNRKKVFILISVLVALTIIITGIRFFYHSTINNSKEPTAVNHVSEKQNKPNKKVPITEDVNHNASALEKQIREFVPLFYNAQYADNSEKEIADYVTTDFLNSIQEEENSHGVYEDKDFHIYISGVTLYVPIDSDVSNDNTIKVLTAFNTSIRSSGSPEINRPILVELTMVYNDTWRVNSVKDKSSLSQRKE